LTASAVEIEFLGYERFKPVPHPCPATPHAVPDEEAHCNKNKVKILNSCFGRAQNETYCLGAWNSFLRTGWPPTGGVWVLYLTEGEAVKTNAGIIFKAYSMEERCQVIEQLGGTIYANPEDCLELD
ncbi:uncharacterized protein THITE_2027417, partial [Thermothielavioides terrestris NRRL 8126]